MWRHAATIRQPRQAVHALSADYLFDRPPRGPCLPRLRFQPASTPDSFNTIPLPPSPNCLPFSAVDRIFSPFLFHRDRESFFGSRNWTETSLTDRINRDPNFPLDRGNDRTFPSSAGLNLWFNYKLFFLIIKKTAGGGAHEFSQFYRGGSRISYARQIAVMTARRGKKCHVRGKQNVSRAYIRPSLLPLLSTSSPLLARSRAFDPSRFQRGSLLSSLPFVYIYARFSCFSLGWRVGKATGEPNVEKKRLCPLALWFIDRSKSIEERFHGSRII